MGDGSSTQRLRQNPPFLINLDNCCAFLRQLILLMLRVVFEVLISVLSSLYLKVLPILNHITVLHYSYGQQFFAIHLKVERIWQCNE